MPKTIDRKIGGPALSTRIPTVHRNISQPVLDRVVLDDDDTCVVLLFVRLRSLLFELCDHPVALCETCGRAYTPEQLGTEIGNGCYLCRQCGADLRGSLVAHARTCPNLAPQKPLARMTSVNSTIPPASERFEVRRRIRLEAHAAR